MTTWQRIKAFFNDAFKSGGTVREEQKTAARNATISAQSNAEKRNKELLAVEKEYSDGKIKIEQVDDLSRKFEAALTEWKDTAIKENKINPNDKAKAAIKESQQFLDTHKDLKKEIDEAKAAAEASSGSQAGSQGTPADPPNPNAAAQGAATGPAAGPAAGPPANSQASSQASSLEAGDDTSDLGDPNAANPPANPAAGSAQGGNSIQDELANEGVARTENIAQNAEWKQAPNYDPLMNDTWELKINGQTVGYWDNKEEKVVNAQGEIITTVPAGPNGQNIDVGSFGNPRENTGKR
jgi:hypothetical protein